MTTKLNPRILKEIKLGLESKLFKFCCDYDGIFGKANDCYIKWTVQDGIYAGQEHLLKVSFIYGSLGGPLIFPKNPPNVLFLTPIYHSNISTNGIICLDVLKSQDPNNPQSWSPIYNIEAVFNSIVNLLENQNVSSPMNFQASLDFTKMQPDAFKNKCQDYYSTRMTENNNSSIKKIMEIGFA